MKVKIGAGLVLMSVLAGLVFAQSSGHGRELTVEDYYKIKTVGDPQMSPNGKWVAFTVSTKIEEDNTTAVQTYVVPSDGSAPPRKIQHDGKDVAVPRWTDDNLLQYSLNARTNSAIFIPGGEGLSGEGIGQRGGNAANQGQLWKVSVDTANAVPVKADPRPQGVVSPDGKWIVFELGANEAETNIFKMQTAGGEPIQLTYFNHAMTKSPAWSPDGQRIAFVSDQNGTPRVWTLNANGGAPQPLEETNAANTNDYLVWWPSRDIVYQKSGIRNYLRIDGNTQTAVIPLSQESVGWVPGRPIFSRDGNKVAVMWNRQPEPGLWIISLEPYSETFVLAGGVSPFGWSPDGKYVYAARQGSEIIRVRSGPPNEISSVPALPGGIVNHASASVSPDERQIIVSVAAEASDVWLIENKQ